MYQNHSLWKQLRLQKLGGAHYFPIFNSAGTAYTTVILFLLQQQPQLE